MEEMKLDHGRLPDPVAEITHALEERIRDLEAEVDSLQEGPEMRAAQAAESLLAKRKES
jgi:hypothetical protein